MPDTVTPAEGALDRPWTRRVRDERGYAILLSAILLLPLLAFAGFAVDIGSWYVQANRMQRAADAAALAAVVWMPNDEKAEQIALETAKANGFDNAAADVTVTVTPIGNRRIRVYIQDTDVDMYLSSIFLDSVDIERQSTAEYVQAIPMGSPDNILGNDPERIGTAGYTLPYYWLNVAGPLAEKQQGDRYTAKNCNSTYSGCTASTSAGTNLDYSTTGYFYRITVDARPSSGDLRIQAFDPVYLSQGSTCTSNQLSSDTTTFNNQVAVLVAQGTADAATRYQRGNSSWCTADTNFGGSTIKTSFVVRAPDNTPFDNYDNPIICGRTFDAYDEALYPLLNNTDGYQDGNIGTQNMRFSDVFRKWVDLCTVPWGSVQFGDYLLQVNTTADLSNPISSLGSHSSTVSTGGHNKFSLRAGFGSPTSSTFATGLNVFADGRLPIYVNQAAGGTQFYLARILPEYAGQILELELFDVADGANAALTIIPPTDRTGNAISGCTFIRDAATPTVTTSASCSITGLTNALYNGRLLTVQVPLPENYGCNAGSEFGCWFKILLDFGSGSPTDQTTWSARVRGDPVRLVE